MCLSVCVFSPLLCVCEYVLKEDTLDWLACCGQASPTKAIAQ